MHGTSVSGVSFTRLSHCEDVTAPAPVGTSSTAAAQQSGTSHRCRNRDLVLAGIRASLSVFSLPRTCRVVSVTIGAKPLRQLTHSPTTSDSEREASYASRRGRQPRTDLLSKFTLGTACLAAYACEKSPVPATLAGGFPITIAISFRSVNSIARGS